VQEEPGGITQGVRTVTSQVAYDVARRPSGAQEESAGGALGKQPKPSNTLSAREAPDARMTLLDTPGHEAFELTRGRTMAAADLAVVVVSVERGAEVQTEEVLLHANRWGVPIIFALNKIDLPSAHVNLTRAELRRQCQRLHEQGLVDTDWTREAEEAVPISALQGLGLGDLVRRVRQVLAGLPVLPSRMPRSLSATPGAAMLHRNRQRRTDFLIGIEQRPSALALVVEIEKGGSQGETTLTLIVRAGRLAVGQYFVVGTAFGRVARLAIALGGDAWVDCETATTGMAVHLTGLRTKALGGDCALDDLLLSLPRERAWRLSEHRRRIEALMGIQTCGPPIEVPWEQSSQDLVARTQAAFERDRHAQPEKHSASAYERRWVAPAIAEFPPRDAGSTSVFSEVSRRVFHDTLSQSGAGVVGPEIESEFLGGAGGRKSSQRRAPAPTRNESEGGCSSSSSRSGSPSLTASRFKVLSPSGREAPEGVQPPGASGGGSRQSSRPALLATGAWTPFAAPEKDFVYYTERQTWAEEAYIATARVRSRWQWRDTARWEEQERQKKLHEMEKKLAEEVRSQVFGEAGLPYKSAGRAAAEEETNEGEEDEVEEEDCQPRPLPRRNLPVVPLILKTRNVGQFDVIMDEVERVQDEQGCQIVIVHGGIGPVIPRDVVHAEVEKYYGFCPIYAFQVGATADAAGHAEAEKIDIRRFDVFVDLIADVAERCNKIHSKGALKGYADSLKQHPTSSGI